MKVSSVDRKPFINARNTGYVAATSIGVAMVSAYSKNKSIRVFHKPAAILATIATLLHIGIIESYQHKRHKM